MPKKSNQGIGCWVLFSIPFAGAGIFMAYLLLSVLVSWFSMRSWQAVPAKIITTELVSSRGSDSTTYKMSAQYEYTFQNRKYIGERIGLHTGSDNIGSYHHRVYQELLRYKSTVDEFHCFVNPKKPSEAVLYRNFRWEKLGFYSVFLFVFGGFGFGMLFFAGYAKKKIAKNEALAAKHPEKPWLWQPEWEEGRIRSSNKTIMITATCFALFWNLISSPMLFIIPSEITKKGNKAALIGLLFPVIGIGLLTWAIRSILRWNRFGESVFEMKSVPGVVGGALAGVIKTKVNIRPEDSFRLQLACINKRITGSGKNRTTSERILWEDHHAIQHELLQRDFQQSAIPVLFKIPFDSIETNNDDSDSEIYWRLTTEAAVPGIDYKAQFQIPVFRTTESNPHFVLAESEITRMQQNPDPGDALHDSGIRLEKGMSTLRIIFPMFRQKIMATFLTLFTAIWTGLTIFLFKAGVPILPLVFGLFNIFLLLATLDLLLGSKRIEVHRDQIILAGGIFGVGKIRQFPVSAIQEVEATPGTQYGNKLLYRINVLLNNGKRYTAVRRINSRQLAELIITEIKDFMKQ